MIAKRDTLPTDHGRSCEQQTRDVGAQTGIPCGPSEWRRRITSGGRQET